MARVYLTSTATGNPLNKTTFLFNTFISEIIYKNDETITQATLNATTSGSGTPIFYLSADAGFNFEVVTSGIIHIFENTGEDVKCKITGADVNITKYEVIIA